LIIREIIGGALADIDEVACGEARERFRADVLSSEVAADQSGVGLADFDEELVCLVVRDARDVETLVLIAVAQDWKVNHRQDYRLFRIDKISVNAFDDGALETRERADVAHAVPRILVTWWFTLGFVAFEEARHEELLRQSC
jgi:hypothetical protein